MPALDDSPAYASASGYFGSDQGWISAKLGLGEATWDEHDGVLSYRRDCHSSGLPENARIVFFHGPTDPSILRIQEQSPWIKQHWV